MNFLLGKTLFLTQRSAIISLVIRSALFKWSSKVNPVSRRSLRCLKGSLRYSAIAENDTGIVYPTNTPRVSTLKRCENDRSHVVSTWNACVVFVGYLLLSLLTRVLVKIHFPKKGKAINLIKPSLNSVLEELLSSVAENKNASSANNLVLEERPIGKSLMTMKKNMSQRWNFVELMLSDWSMGSQVCQMCHFVPI